MMELVYFSATLLTLLGGHALLLSVVIGFFSIDSRPAQMALGLAMLFLFLSVLFSSYLIHKRDNLFTRIYYIGSALWIGIFVNLALVSTLIVIIKIAGPLLDFYLPLWLQHLIFFSGTAAISAAGIYNALKPKIVEYEVFIKDLPDSWVDKTVVQISDVHLGPVYRRRFFYSVIDRINELKPEAVFITGDLFDGMEAEFTWLNHPFTRLHAPRGAYYSFGNHDLYLGFSRVKRLLSENPIKILDNKLVNIDGLQIIGINYSFDSNFDLERAIRKLEGYNQDLPSVLLFHAPKNIDAAKKANINLQLSGHTHDGQMFPYNLVIKWGHRGYGYGFFPEGDFNLIVNGGVGTWGPPMRTSARSEIVKIILRKK